MANPKSVELTRERLRSLASELVELSKTFEPRATSALDIEPEIVTRARSLIVEAQTPMDHAMSLLSTSMETATIQTLLYLNALQSIPKSGAISLEELSTKTNTQAALLERLLRIVVGSGLVHQDDSRGYSHTPRSEGYGENGFAGQFLTFICEGGVDILMRFPEYLEEKRALNGFVKEPDSATHNPATWVEKQEGKTIFEIWKQKPAKMQALSKMMGVVTHINPWVGFYDFSKLATSEPDRAVFVDVGGGHGHAIKHMLTTHPEIQPEQCVLQDMQAVLDFAQADNTELPKGVTFQAHDYFSPQPVKGARAYHLRAIAHDLGDENLVAVLKQIVPAMATDSKVLIADNVLPERGAQGLGGFMDMMMLAIGGKERTERNFREICANAGLKVDGVHKVPPPRTYAIVEASLV